MLRKFTLTATALAATTAILTGCGSAEGNTETSAKEATSSATPAPAMPKDSDADGLADDEDAFPHDDTEWLDFNDNGIGDNADAEARRVAEKAAAAKAKREKRERAAAEEAAAVSGAVAPTERQWAQIVKDPDSHVGEYYVVYGQINQFDAATGDDTFLADSANHNTMSYGYFDGDNSMFTTEKKSTFGPFVEDDVFVATVQVAGSFSYDTQIGGNTTVPLLMVRKINLA